MLIELQLFLSIVIIMLGIVFFPILTDSKYSYITHYVFTGISIASFLIYNFSLYIVFSGMEGQLFDLFVRFKILDKLLYLKINQYNIWFLIIFNLIILLERIKFLENLKNSFKFNIFLEFTCILFGFIFLSQNVLVFSMLFFATAFLISQIIIPVIVETKVGNGKAISKLFVLTGGILVVIAAISQFMTQEKTFFSISSSLNSFFNSTDIVWTNILSCLFLLACLFFLKLNYLLCDLKEFKNKKLPISSYILGLYCVLTLFLANYKKNLNVNLYFDYFIGCFFLIVALFSSLLCLIKKSKLVSFDLMNSLFLFSLALIYFSFNEIAIVFVCFTVLFSYALNYTENILNQVELDKSNTYLDLKSLNLVNVLKTNQIGALLTALFIGFPFFGIFFIRDKIQALLLNELDAKSIFLYILCLMYFTVTFLILIDRFLIVKLKHEKNKSLLLISNNVNLIISGVFITIISFPFINNHINFGLNDLQFFSHFNFFNQYEQNEFLSDHIKWVSTLTILVVPLAVAVFFIKFKLFFFKKVLLLDKLFSKFLFKIYYIIINTIKELSQGVESLFIKISRQFDFIDTKGKFLIEHIIVYNIFLFSKLIYPLYRNVQLSFFNGVFFVILIVGVVVFYGYK